jgi:hypothetical protein
VSDDFIAIVKKSRKKKKLERTTGDRGKVNRPFLFFSRHLFIFYFILFYFSSLEYRCILFTTESLLCWGSLHLARIKGGKRTDGRSLVSGRCNQRTPSSPRVASNRRSEWNARPQQRRLCKLYYTQLVHIRAIREKTSPYALLRTCYY